MKFEISDAVQRKHECVPIDDSIDLLTEKTLSYLKTPDSQIII